jgi:hypothetical protein
MKYDVQTMFVFSGVFTIEAETKEQARGYVEEHCGMVNIGGIHSTLPCDDVDWDYPVHPDKVIGRIRISRKKGKAYEQAS